MLHRTRPSSVAFGLVVATWLAFPARMANADVGSALPSDRRIAILAYHDVSDDPVARLDVVSPAFLRAQIRACRRAGWTFLPLSTVMAHRNRPEALPPRVMVLTFDDGYRSFRELALPVLEQERVPATIGLVTSWFDRPPPGLPPLMTWDDVRAAQASGWVEVASHSHDLHRYETCNPWRDTWTSLSTRRFLLDGGRYEDRDEYRTRIRADFAATQRVLQENLGSRGRLLVWPYGDHNTMARALAAEAGFEATLALGSRLVTAADLRSGCLPRFLMSRDEDSSGTAWLDPEPRPVRAAQVDLDALYDPDTLVFTRRVDALVRRVRALGATHVFLQACPDPHGDGMFEAAWFMNHQVPVRADVWSMAARKFQHASLRVWIRAPVMNLSWVWASRPEWRIPYDPARASDGKTPWYFRVSPNLAQVRRAAIDFYADLAVYLPIDGVLFDDDAYMLPGERLNGSAASTPSQKAEAIDAMIEEVKSAVRDWRPEAKFARNVYAPVVDRAGVDPEFAQDFERSLRSNDLTVVMAYARMEGHQRDAARWTGTLARRALARAVRAAGRNGRSTPVMIKLQAYDWERDAPVPSAELTAVAREARRAGVTSIGVYPVLPEPFELPGGLLEAPRLDSVATQEAGR